jgi:GNAT superfamily N-acetyltransferase
VLSLSGLSKVSRDATAWLRRLQVRSAARSVVAIDEAAGRVAGLVNMLGDGVLTAFIPWLEVLPGYQGRGVGSELMRRILDGTERFCSADPVRARADLGSPGRYRGPGSVG